MYPEANREEEFANKKHNKPLFLQVGNNYINSVKSQLLNSMFLAAIAADNNYGSCTAMRVNWLSIGGHSTIMNCDPALF